MFRILSNPKQYLCTVAVLLCFCPAGLAQQQLPPNSLSTFPVKHLPATRAALAGEVTFTTYGAGIGFPILWIEENVKVVPLFGVMWQNFASGGFQSRSATGVKLLYFFKNQPIDLVPTHSLYSGIGGMGTISNFFEGTANVYSRIGAILGYNFIVGDRVQLAPELFFGINEAESLRFEIGFVIQFKRS
jgi:hypothetical protein